MSKAKTDEAVKPLSQEKHEPLYFEEWSVRLAVKREQEGPHVVDYVTPVKLEKLRDRVVIDQHHADILNEGRLAPSCVNPILYFKPGQDVSEFTRKYYPKTN